MTGHADGLITLDLAESDDAHRERMREEMGEPYRTVLGHLRHEIGHYYWPILAPDAADAANGRARAVRRRTRGLPGGAGPPLRERPAGRLGRALRQRLRDHAPDGGLGGDVRPLPPHPRHAADRRAPTASGSTAGPARTDGMAAMLDAWLPLTYALNALNRSMGRDDLYPFVLPPPVMEKLALVHELVTTVNDLELAEQAVRAGRRRSRSTARASALTVTGQGVAGGRRHRGRPGGRGARPTG